MKLAIVAPLVSPIREPQRGGSQAFVSDLARGLVDRGHDVHLYAASGSEVPGVEVIDTGVDHRGLAATLYRASRAARRCRLGGGRAGLRRVYAAVREARYDVVHNHAFDAPAIALASALSAPGRAHASPAPGRGGCRRAAPGAPSATRRRRSPVVSGQPGERVAPDRPGRRDPAAVHPDAVRSAGRRARDPARCSPAGSVRRREPPRRSRSPQAQASAIDVFGDSYDAEYAREQIDPRRAEPGVVVHPASRRRRSGRRWPARPSCSAPRGGRSRSGWSPPRRRRAERPSSPSGAAHSMRSSSTA